MNLKIPSSIHLWCGELLEAGKSSGIILGLQANVVLQNFFFFLLSTRDKHKNLGRLIYLLPGVLWILALS